MLVQIDRVDNYFYVNNKKITGRQDFEKLTAEEKWELKRKRKDLLNETSRPKRR